MLKISLRIFFTVLVMALANLLMPLQADAQTHSADYPSDYTAATKTLYIEMARAGDPEALYQLGLMHLRGLGASQNDKVARSFFKHAVRQGHSSAQIQLIAMGPAQVAPVVSSMPEPKPQSVITTSKPDRVYARKEAARKKAVQRKKVEARKKQRAKLQAERKAATIEKRRKARQAALATKRQAAIESKRIAALEANKTANTKAAEKARLEATAKPTPEQILSEPGNTAKPIAPKEPHHQIASMERDSLPPVIAKSEIPTSRQSVADQKDGILKGTLTAFLLILMFAAMVLMGRRIRQ